MTAFLGFLAAAIAFAGTLLDYFLSDRRKDAFFATLARLGKKLDRTSAGDLVGSEAEAVLLVLERLFGARTLSLRRLATVFVAYVGTLVLAYLLIEYARFLAGLPWRPPFDEFHFSTGFPGHYMIVFVATDVSVRTGRLLARVPRLDGVGPFIFAALHGALFLVSLAISDLFSARLAHLLVGVPASALAIALHTYAGVDSTGWLPMSESYEALGQLVGLALADAANNILNLLRSLPFGTVVVSGVELGESGYRERTLGSYVLYRVTWPASFIENYSEVAAQIGASWRPGTGVPADAFVPVSLYAALMVWFMPVLRIGFALGYAYAWIVARLGSRFFASALHNLAARRGPVFSLMLGAVSLVVAALALLGELSGDSHGPLWIAPAVPV